MSKQMIESHREQISYFKNERANLAAERDELAMYALDAFEIIDILDSHNREITVIDIDIKAYEDDIKLLKDEVQS